MRIRYQYPISEFMLESFSYECSPPSPPSARTQRQTKLSLLPLANNKQRCGFGREKKIPNGISLNDNDNFVFGPFFRTIVSDDV